MKVVAILKRLYQRWTPQQQRFARSVLIGWSVMVLGLMSFMASVITAPADQATGKPELGTGALAGLSVAAVGALVMVASTQLLRRSIRKVAATRFPTERGASGTPRAQAP